MLLEVASKINDMVNQADKKSYKLVEQVVNELNQLSVSEQLGIHSSLSAETLELIYNFRFAAKISDDVLEHIIWWYFVTKIEQQKTISNKTIQDILDEYTFRQSVALESILISALKSNKLTDEQVGFVDKVISSKVYRKERYAYECRRKIADGIELEVHQIQQLLENRSYTTIELALAKRLISKKGLLLLTAPYTGLHDKKHRIRLARMAQELIQMPDYN